MGAPAIVVGFLIVAIFVWFLVASVLCLTAMRRNANFEAGIKTWLVQTHLRTSPGGGRPGQGMEETDQTGRPATPPPTGGSQRSADQIEGPQP
jgi:hypothetical protein